ncbi:glycine zipper 2TM domain-containing protein [Pseudoduganella sp.]|uniref:glycine zipper 2TM domain-containing protein n=1 Tax=Pseudoduganella sp. TaxID=1880898 RepID=UPI0035B22754
MQNENNIMRYTTHPMLLIAAIAVVLFCGVGIAAIMGWLPSSGATMGPPVAEAPVPVGAQDNMGPPPAPAAYAAGRAPAADSSGYSGAGSYGAGAPAATPAAAPPLAAHAPAPAPAAAPTPAICRSCGVVESVRTIKQRAEGSGLGAAGGAILGGLLGNQIGSGSGRKVATVAGAVGGAVVGNQVEGNMKATTHYEVRVRMEDGKVRTISSSSASWQPGEPVKVVKGRLQRR